jgi:hypothetical protein
MNIINVNSPYNLDPAIVQYAHSIASSFDLYGDMGPFRSDSLADVMNRIPVILFNASSMPVVPSIEANPADEAGKNIDLWGYYQHAFPIRTITQHPVTCNIPVIALCLERIIERCKRNDGSFDAVLYSILTAKVIIHEYAHAMMALPHGSIGVTYDNFYLWMEEAMANAFTLHCFHAHHRSRTHHQHHFTSNEHRITYDTPSLGLDPIAVVTDFMRSQPANYSLGVFLHEQGLGHYWLWSMMKESCNSRSSEKDAWKECARTVSKDYKDGLQPNEIESFKASFYNVLGTSQSEVEHASVMYHLEKRLFHAVLCGDVRSCSTLLIENGVSVNCTDINGWTPFQWVKHVKHKNQVEIAKILVEYGADVDYTIDDYDVVVGHFGDGELDWLPDPLSERFTYRRRARGAFGRF